MLALVTDVAVGAGGEPLEMADGQFAAAATAGEVGGLALGGVFLHAVFGGVAAAKPLPTEKRADATGGF